ncbi:peptidoglycan DD-metalloendopeptidase family protein, partial [Clostridium saudiense]|nr:peptidoglycan DD-metalloendopeptidase family protein [Clostridium saudiense]
NVNGFAITVDNNIFGYVLSAQEKDSIIKSVCESYIRELGVNIEDISYMKINGNIKTTPTELKLCQLSESSEISKEIYEASIVNKNLLDLELSLRTFEEEVIESPVRVEEDSSIYMGEEIVMQGEDGKKEVYKEVVYEGLAKVEETVLNENILVEPVDTVVHKGVKNPYYDGVTFLSRPVEGGYISSYYGEERVNSYHKGLDIAENLGEDIIASFDGKVIFAGYNDGGYGNLVIVQHSDDMKTYYAHLSEIYVSPNQEVKKGEIIGAVGSTGYSTGPHLHFE